MSKPFSNFSIATGHLEGVPRYHQVTARSAFEKTRRATLPSEACMAEQQSKGINVAREILKKVYTPQELQFASNVLSSAGINSTWYTYVEGSKVMRREVSLPILTDTTTGKQKSPDDLLTETIYDSRIVAINAMAYRNIVASPTLAPRSASFKRAVGRQIGELSLKMAALSVPDLGPASTPYLRQREAREAAMDSTRNAKLLALEIGIAPSFAQLCDEHSPLVAYIAAEAPDSVYESLGDALGSYGVSR